MQSTSASSPERQMRAGPAEPAVDLVGDQERARLVAALAQPLEEAVRRNARAGAALHRLDDHAAGVLRQRPGSSP